MIRSCSAARAAVACCALALCADAIADDAPTHLDRVTITGPRPTSLPTSIPTTVEGVTGAEVEQRINAFDSEDALKYLPSLNVRKRYNGDYDHAVLASRASGTGNSARSLVYADGILLSNLLGNGATYTPRWGLVTPEEIERVDVLYGPFSAAYPGNSVGAVVDYQTRMPAKREAHVKLSAFSQGFRLYHTDDRYNGWQGSASLGDRSGDWSWWIDVSRLDSDGQPIAFANRLVSSGKPDGGGVPVTGAVAGRNPSNADWLLLGATNQTHTVQDHAKAKLAWDITPKLRASYTLGWWENDAERTSDPYLHDAAGAPVIAGRVAIDGRSYDLKASDFAPSIGRLEHVMQGLSVKRHSRDAFDWEVAVSQYDYTRDQVRTPTVAVPDAATNGAGQVTDMHGSGWTTFAAKGVWRPHEAHTVEFGAQSERAKLRTRVYAAANDWIGAADGAQVSIFNGNTWLESLWAQDAWKIADDWRATLGLRREHWRAYGGELSNAVRAAPLPFPDRDTASWSPKAALSWRASDAWNIKASVGRAVRNPTAAELFQGSIVDNAIVNSNPNLRAEKSWTGELSAETIHDRDALRLTLFRETTRDALYSQPLLVSAGTTVNVVQNVGRIRTNGLEVSSQADDAGRRIGIAGLSLNASLTFADSIITDNPGFPASVGKWQPRVPRWRGTLLAAWQPDDRWSTSVGVRYSGRQYGTLDNSDPNGAAYMGVSDYLVLDARVRYRIDRHWSAALGIDNLGNRTYWAFHPYTQRTAVGELRWDW